MIRKWFGGGDEEDEPPRTDYALEDLQVGYLVDFDLKTWEVIGYNVYDYDGFETREWELRCGEEVRFLELAVDDGQAEWVLTRKIGLRQLDPEVAAAIIDSGDPPEEVRLAGRPYLAVESSAGQMREGGGGRGHEFVNWSYESEEGERVLFISQWGERDFRAYEGEYVEEYQFTDILPGKKEKP